jgi:hypothetical protein
LGRGRRAGRHLLIADTLLLKLVLTPALIAVASLAGRRWGPAIGGWLVGLPLTSGPVAFFLALDHGTGFAAAAAVGSLAGALAEVAFCLAYGRLARHGWPLAFAAACAAFGAVALVLQRLALGPAALAVAIVLALVLTLRLVRADGAARDAAPPPRWDLPARMVITTALVVAITGAAATLGPRLSGVLATFPVYAAILTIFAHRAGPAPAVQVLRGLLLGLLAFAGFFLVLGAVIERLGLAAAFTLATATALAIQAASLVLVLPRADSAKLERGLPGR